jgi:lysozyme
MFTVLLVMIVMASSIALLAFLFKRQIVQQYSDLNPQHYVYGIDVSHHQKQIDWPQLKDGKARFVYIKSTEGATFRDPRFIENWNGAQQAGLTPGAYHFFTFCRSGADQADNFLAVFNKVKGMHLPIALDVELVGNCPKRPTPDELAIELNSFITKVKAQTGCHMLFYTTPAFYDSYLAGHFDTYPLWLQSFKKKPKLKSNHSWRIWQFSNQGRVDGIQALVDLNAFKGSPQQFEQLLCKPAHISK